MRQILTLVVAVLPLLFFMRLQRKRVRAQQAVIESVGVGAEVMTTSGFYGRVTAIDGDIATLELAPNVTVRIAKGALGQVLDSTANVPANTAANAGTSVDTPILRNTSLPSTEEQR
jgi:preprotein translocase subunit YajC